MTPRWLLWPFLVLSPIIPASAQDWPSKTVTVVVPFTPAGSTDLLARIAAQVWEQRIGKPFVVENRPGAGQQVGVNAVAKAAPDGHTLLMATSSAMAVNPTLYKKITYDPVKDFQPIALVAHLPFILVVNPALPINSVADLIKYAKENPGKLSFGSGGVGASHHLYGEMFKSLTGVQMTHVPYRGTLPALNDVIAGHIPLLFSDPPPALPQIAAGKVRAIGVTTAKRIVSLPNVPPIGDTVQGLRYGALADADGARGHAAPDHRPAAQRDRALHRESRGPGEVGQRDGPHPGRPDFAGRTREVRREGGRGLGQARPARWRRGDRVAARYISSTVSGFRRRSSYSSLSPVPVASARITEMTSGCRRCWQIATLIRTIQIRP